MTVTVFVPPAVPVIADVGDVKPVTAALKTTVKLIGDNVGWVALPAGLVDRDRRAARRPGDHVVRARRGEVRAGCGIQCDPGRNGRDDRARGRHPVTRPRCRSFRFRSPSAVGGPPAVPDSVTSPVVKPVTLELNTTVKLIGEVAVGSAWPVAWLIVTDGPRRPCHGVVTAGRCMIGPTASVRATSAGTVAMTVPVVVMPDTATL